MASDLISRKALLKVLKEHEQEWNNTYYVGLGLRIAISEVEEQPAVKAVEVGTEIQTDICKTTNLPCIRCNPGPCDHREVKRDGGSDEL